MSDSPSETGSELFDEPAKKPALATQNQDLQMFRVKSKMTTTKKSPVKKSTSKPGSPTKNQQ